MKMKLIVVLTAILVSSCTSTVPPNMTKTVNASDPIAPSSTPEPSSVDTKTPLSTTPSSPILLTPSPWPTMPVFTTPDADQLARWQEYEYALGKALLSRELLRGAVLCEWEILGQSNSEIYVWAACTGTVPVGEQGIFPGAESPAVIFQETAGEIKNVEVPGAGTHYAYDIRKMFPVDVQERIFSRLIDFRRLSEHLETRLDNPEPPLIVLSAMSAPNPVLGTLLPTQLTIVPTLNPTQVIQQEEIKSVIQEYFDIHYQALSISPPANFQETGFGDLISDMPEARDFEEIEVAKLQVQAKYWELNKFRFTDCNHTLEYDSFTFDQEKNQVTVYLLDKAEAVQEISLVRNPKDPRVTYLEFGHIFILHKEGEEWKIVSDTYFDSWWQQFRKPGATKEEILNAIDAKRQKLNQTP